MRINPKKILFTFTRFYYKMFVVLRNNFVILLFLLKFMRNFLKFALNNQIKVITRLFLIPCYLNSLILSYTCGECRLIFR